MYYCYTWFTLLKIGKAHIAFWAHIALWITESNMNMTRCPIFNRQISLWQCVVFVVSVLETEKSLVLAEKGSGDNDDVELIKAAAGFRLVATMNPGGDFGKKEVDMKRRECLLSVELWMKVAATAQTKGADTMLIRHWLVKDIVLYLTVMDSPDFEGRVFAPMI